MDVVRFLRPVLVATRIIGFAPYTFRRQSGLLVLESSQKFMVYSYILFAVSLVAPGIFFILTLPSLEFLNTTGSILYFVDLVLYLSQTTTVPLITLRKASLLCGHLNKVNQFQSLTITNQSFSWVRTCFVVFILCTSVLWAFLRA